jgi:ferritin
MKIKEKVQKAINTQINRELYSYYLYLGMSAYCESLNLKGFAHWLRLQAQEEQAHAMKLFDYIFDRGGCVLLADIKAAPTPWKSPLECFMHVYDHEVKVTGYINEVLEVALETRDTATGAMLQWFINEQVEEEAAAQLIVEKLKMIKDSTNGLLMLDFELSNRK